MGKKENVIVRELGVRLSQSQSRKGIEERKEEKRNRPMEVPVGLHDGDMLGSVHHHMPAGLGQEDRKKKKERSTLQIMHRTPH